MQLVVGKIRIMCLFFLRKFASCADVVKKPTIYLSPRSNLGLTLNWHEKEIYSVSNVEEQKSHKKELLGDKVLLSKNMLISFIVLLCS